MSLAIMVMPVYVREKIVEEIFLINQKIIVFLPSIIQKDPSPFQSFKPN